jgi:hypothetical protein
MLLKKKYLQIHRALPFQVTVSSTMGTGRECFVVSLPDAWFPSLWVRLPGLTCELLRILGRGKTKKSHSSAQQWAVEAGSVTRPISVSRT